MLVLGLTGSIATGKSTVARIFRQLRVPVHEADRCVHRLLHQDSPLIATIQTAFPELTRQAITNRTSLADYVFAHSDTLMHLEAIIHPRVAQEQLSFLRQQARHRSPLVLLEVPLLFEVGVPVTLDAVIVVTVHPWLQKTRAMRRPGMTTQRLTAILQRQYPPTVKLRQANFVIHTGRGIHEARKAVLAILEQMTSQPKRHHAQKCRRSLTRNRPRY